MTTTTLELQFVFTVDEALAALRDAGYTVTLNTAWGCRFYMLAAPGRVATHGYTADQLITFADQELF